MPIGRRSFRRVLAGLSLLALLIGARHGFARDKYETIDAQAFGTGTQMGQNIGITVIIYDFSPPRTKAACWSTPSPKVRTRAW